MKSFSISYFVMEVLCQYYLDIITNKTKFTKNELFKRLKNIENLDRFILYDYYNEEDDCIVVTKDNEYVIRKSIVTILDELDDSFCKSHRSCIVNINNIRRVDFDNNIIYFDNSSIDLLSRSNRKSLKEKMGILNDK